ncbi:MAG: HEPN domain-containing protein [Candidatus Latescibacteria bacterium]|jgi:HEPN domain-containing protein|nr:HEPN domain-containing protein [Candidatus Latescibacterota bacterium]MBT4136883.1 HEPN domain-containing protein [Candidatus Latescibacterota bacterium]MBT5830789.1 HEPN domain-containing protein [Candidatus Latescibacterota bacterium]
MLPENFGSGSPAEWLRYAKSDLALAQIAHTPNIMYENLCFHAQQAAEKALKATLINRNISFPKTHNIRTILDLLPKEIILPTDIDDAASLTDYAVLSRYPNDDDEIEKEEYQEAIRLAQSVVQWAEAILDLPDTKPENENLDP